MKVVYGHTDSIYVQIGSVETAKECVKEIEGYVREHFPNVLNLPTHPVILEFEKYYSSLGVGTTKNRNAGTIVWKDGHKLEKPEFTMTGFVAKRVSATALEKEVQTKVLKMWVDGKSLVEINSYLYSIYTNLLENNVDFRKLLKRTRVTEERFIVKCNSCNRKYHLNSLSKIKVCGEKEGRDGTHKCGELVSNFRTTEDKRPSISSGMIGVISAWQNSSKTFDGSYLWLKIDTSLNNRETYISPLTKQVKLAQYVAGNVENDFKNITPDLYHYAEQVIKKAKPIYLAMGWDIASIRSNKIQSSLEEWF